MKSQNFEHTGSWQHDPHGADLTQACGGVLALLEIAVASTVVVGFFDALSQPLGWQAVAQCLLCSSLAGLLWLADARREPDVSFAGNSPVAGACRESVRYEPTRQES